MNFIEVCSGCGGLSCGFIKAGFIPVLLNDNDKICCETLKNNHKNTKIICDSMLNLDLTEYKNKVDVLCGGAGERKGLNDERGNLILKFKDLIDVVEPKIFMIENVKGLTTHDKGNTFNKVLEKLKNGDKYDIYYDILNAVYYNVPQKRERLIIIGVNKKYVFPIITP
jgi:DNA (cytosine-5)-methyltransferase 1